MSAYNKTTASLRILYYQFLCVLCLDDWVLLCLAHTVNSSVVWFMLPRQFSRSTFHTQAYSGWLAHTTTHGYWLLVGEIVKHTHTYIHTHTHTQWHRVRINWSRTNQTMRKSFALHTLNYSHLTQHFSHRQNSTFSLLGDFNSCQFCMNPQLLP